MLLTSRTFAWTQPVVAFALLTVVTGAHASVEAATEGTNTTPSLGASASPPSADSRPSVTPSRSTDVPIPPLSTYLEVHLINSSSAPNSIFFGALAAASSQPLAFVDDGAATPGLAQLSIVYAPERHELALSFSRPGHETITRSIEAPADPQTAAQVAALLAVNLISEQVELPTAPLAAVIPVVAPAPTPEPPEPKAALSEELAPPRPFHIATASFFYPIATNYADPAARTHLNFNLLYGSLGELDGLELGSVNVVSRPARGLQIGALLNAVGGGFQGIQVAGGLSSAESLTSGLQVGGLATHSRSAATGVQAALALNIAGGAMKGLQVAMGSNFSGNASIGAQASGLFNVSGNLRGLQVAPLLNLARDMTGVQVGLLNIARKVRGSQVGFVNIADDVIGVPLGFASITRTGGVHVAAWASTSTYATLGLKLATRYTYTMLTAGYHRTADTDSAGPGILIGARIPVTKHFEVNVDIGGEYLFGARLCCYKSKFEERLAHAKDRQHYRLRFIPTWLVRPWFSVYGGGGINARVPFALYSDFEASDQTVQLAPELLLGMAL